MTERKYVNRISMFHGLSGADFKSDTLDGLLMEVAKSVNKTFSQDIAVAKGKYGDDVKMTWRLEDTGSYEVEVDIVLDIASLENDKELQTRINREKKTLRDKEVKRIAAEKKELALLARLKKKYENENENN